MSLRATNWQCINGVFVLAGSRASGPAPAGPRNYYSWICVRTAALRTHRRSFAMLPGNGMHALACMHLLILVYKKIVTSLTPCHVVRGHWYVATGTVTVTGTGTGNCSLLAGMPLAMEVGSCAAVRRPPPRTHTSHATKQDKGGKRLAQKITRKRSLRSIAIAS